MKPNRWTPRIAVLEDCEHILLKAPINVNRVRRANDTPGIYDNAPRIGGLS